jgi:hypothetical protein
VTPTLDTDSSKSQYIPTTEACHVGLERTQYTLTLPADALFSGTVIRMTPVEPTGMPGGLVRR